MTFDDMVDRSAYPTMKWSRSFLQEHFGNEDAIPMSVADMDLKAPPAVIEQLQRRAAHGIYGYESKPESHYAPFEAWYRTRHNWPIAREHVEQCPSILSAVAILINQQSDRGDGVIVQPPVFFEFRMVIRDNGRKIVKNPLRLVDGHYQIDYQDLEAKASDPRNTVLILCNPHNPVGRVWTRDELTQVREICARHGVFVIADEIHGDFALPPHRYTPYLTLCDSATSHAAACISPAKTFNISGMVDAMAIIPGEAQREQFHQFAHSYQINKTNVFTLAAIEAAYEHGAAWLDALLGYLQDSVALIDERLAATGGRVSLIEPEGTFLAWLDLRGLGLDVKELERFLAHEADVALAPGYWFGREGAGFARMTIGCPHATLERALDNIVCAVDTLV